MNLLSELKNGTSRPGVCEGPCHTKLWGVDPDNPRLVEFHSQLNYCKDSWRSKQCHHVVNAECLDSKNRCSRCQTLGKNIRPSKNTKLYNAVGKTTDQSISQAVIECDDKFRERILFCFESLEDGADVTQDSELAMTTAQLRLAGWLIFDLHDKRFLVCCSGCDSFEIKDSRSNVSTQCHTCKYNVRNAKRCAKHQEDNKEEWMDVQSRTPFSALSDNKWKQRLLVLNTGQKVHSRKLYVQAGEA